VGGRRAGHLWLPVAHRPPWVVREGEYVPDNDVQVSHRMRCSTWTPAPGPPLRDKLADVTGYPLSPLG
jgi:hypothetical protein